MAKFEYIPPYGIENITTEFLSMIKLPEEAGKELNYLVVMPTGGKGAIGFSLGVAVVTSALKVSMRNVSTLNLLEREDAIERLKDVLTDNIDVIMTGGLSTQFYDVKNVIDLAKEINSDIITVVGGPIITADPIVSMGALENADYGIIGEGEITVNALAHALENDYDPSVLDGIVCKRNGKWIVNDKFPSIPNLNILPFPDFVGFECFENLGRFNKRYRLLTGFSEVVSINISRSCPFNCTFCFHACGNTYRQMSMDKVFELIDWILSLYSGIEVIFLTGELTFSNEEFALEFCRRIKPYNIKWRASIRATPATKEVFAAMKDSGCICVIMGIESADNKILKSMRKGITIEQVEKAMAIADAVGLTLYGNLIFGDKEETWETFCTSINWWHSNKKWSAAWQRYNIELIPIIAYPGSYLYKLACERGTIKNPALFLKERCPLVNISRMTNEEYFMVRRTFYILNVGEKLVDAQITVGNYTVNITGQCPNCSESLTFEHIQLVFAVERKLCPFCGEGLRILPVEHLDSVRLNKTVKALVRETTAAIWAVNRHNYCRMLDVMPVLKSDNIRFINKDWESAIPKVPQSVSKISPFSEAKVFTPDIIRKEGIDTVIVPNGLDVFNDIKATIAAEFPQVKRVVHITELL